MGGDREWLVKHRYKAVQEVLSGQPVTEVAVRFGALPAERVRVEAPLPG